MVGRLTLDQLVEVRILCPQPGKYPIYRGIFVYYAAGGGINYSYGNLHLHNDIHTYSNCHTSGNCHILTDYQPPASLSSFLSRCKFRHKLSCWFFANLDAFAS